MCLVRLPLKIMDPVLLRTVADPGCPRGGEQTYYLARVLVKTA